MPKAALKSCAYPGCQVLVAKGMCAQHAAQVQADPARVHPRDAAVHRLYDRRWKRIRMVHLAEHPWCEDCLKEGRYVPAVDVHHEKRHRGDAVTFYTSPLRSLCHACHSRRTVAEIHPREGG